MHAIACLDAGSGHEIYSRFSSSLPFDVDPSRFLTEIFVMHVNIADSAGDAGASRAASTTLQLETCSARLIRVGTSPGVLVVVVVPSECDDVVHEAGASLLAASLGDAAEAAQTQSPCDRKLVHTALCKALCHQVPHSLLECMQAELGAVRGWCAFLRSPRARQQPSFPKRLGACLSSAPRIAPHGTRARTTAFGPWSKGKPSASDAAALSSQFHWVLAELCRCAKRDKRRLELLETRVLFSSHPNGNGQESRGGPQGGETMGFSTGSVVAVFVVGPRRLASTARARVLRRMRGLHHVGCMVESLNLAHIPDMDDVLSAPASAL